MKFQFLNINLLNNLQISTVFKNLNVILNILESNKNLERLKEIAAEPYGLFPEFYKKSAKKSLKKLLLEKRFFIKNLYLEKNLDFMIEELLLYDLNNYIKNKELGKIREMALFSNYYNVRKRASNFLVNNYIEKKDLHSIIRDFAFLPYENGRELLYEYFFSSLEGFRSFRIFLEKKIKKDKFELYIILEENKENENLILSLENNMNHFSVFYYSEFFKENYKEIRKCFSYTKEEAYIETILRLSFIETLENKNFNSMRKIIRQLNNIDSDVYFSLISKEQDNLKKLITEYLSFIKENKGLKEELYFINDFELIFSFLENEYYFNRESKIKSEGGRI